MATATVTELMLNFADACRALVPSLDRAHVPWRDETQYDNWDRIAEPLFESLVTEPCAFAAVGERGLGRLKVAKYGFVDPNNTWNAYVALASPVAERVIGLSTGATPFDQVTVFDSGRTRTLTLNEAAFVFVYPAADGTKQRLTAVDLEAE